MKAEHVLAAEREKKVAVDVSGLPETDENEESLFSSCADKSVSFAEGSAAKEEMPQEAH